MNTVNSVMCSLSAMMSGEGWGSPEPFFAKATVEIVHSSTGVVAVSMKERRDTANGVRDLIARDLKLLDVDEFEAEWHVVRPGTDLGAQPSA
jgi:hypothetical protein